MTRAVVLPVTLVAIVMITSGTAQTPGNKSEEPEAFDVEPAILKQNLPNDLPASGQTPDANVGRAEKQLQRARQNAAGAERLFKSGVLARVEMEQRVLKVVRCESDLANARVANAKEELAVKESQLAVAEITKEELDTVKTALAALVQAAEVALAKRERAELEAAELNVRRQQKLLKLGIAGKSDVDRAEEKLAELKAPKN
jgi:multidrug resistance efflux pump